MITITKIIKEASIGVGLLALWSPVSLTSISEDPVIRGLVLWLVSYILNLLNSFSNIVGDT